MSYLDARRRRRAAQEFEEAERHWGAVGSQVFDLGEDAFMPTNESKETRKNGGTATLEPDIVEVLPNSGSGLEAQTRGEIDIQISTAKRYPRSIKLFINQATEMATLTEEVAESCFYALPRDGKTVEGPSARLAEIVANAFGHMRIEGRVVNEDDRFVTARGTAWDLQNNVAIAYEVRRRITDRNNKKYKDDMIGVTSNAATSIALRNAVFKVVPSSFWRPIYEQCKKVAVGNAQTLADKRAKMLEYFQKMGVTEARVLMQLGVRGVEDVTLEHLATLKGLATAIKENETTVDEAFSDTTEARQPRRASDAAAATTPPAPVADTNAPIAAATPVQTAVTSAAPSPTPAPAAAVPPAGGTLPPGVSEELRAVKITSVLFVKPKTGDAYYEITVAGKGGARVFVTRDDQLRKEAESFEGTGHYVCLRWRWGVNANKDRVAIVEALTIDDNTALFN
jgi:hypothetical protein